MLPAEAEHVGRHFDKPQLPCMDWNDSLGNQRVLDALRREIGLVFDCESIGRIADRS